MKVRGVVWVGTRTERFDETVTFFQTILGIDLQRIRGDFAWSRMPNSSQLEVFGTTDREHEDLTTGPVPEFLVDDVAEAIASYEQQAWRSSASPSSTMATAMAGSTSAPRTGTSTA